MSPDEALVKAIGDVLVARGLLADGESVGDYVVMVEITGWTPEMVGKTGYVNLVPENPTIPMHRALGLIEVCSGMLDE